MASAVCRSISLTNLAVHEAAITNVLEVKRNGSVFSELLYDVTVTWSDVRKERIFRSYKQFQKINKNLINLISQDKKIIRKNKLVVPTIPRKKLFDFNFYTFMINNLKLANDFLFFLTHKLPQQLHRIPAILNFFEKTASDSEIVSSLQLNNSKDDSKSLHQDLSCSIKDEVPSEDDLVLWWDPVAILPEASNNVKDRENYEIVEPYHIKKEFYLITFVESSLLYPQVDCLAVT